MQLLRPPLTARFFFELRAAHGTRAVTAGTKFALSQTNIAHRSRADVCKPRPAN
jgi:hypothetical protein